MPTSNSCEQEFRVFEGGARWGLIEHSTGIEEELFGEDESVFDRAVNDTEVL